MRVNNEFTFVRKRTSVWERFDQDRITHAILRAARSIGGFASDYLLARRDLYPGDLTRRFLDDRGEVLPDEEIAAAMSDLAVHLLNFRSGIDGVGHPTVEDVQEAVEYALYASGLVDVYEVYRAYRYGRAKVRAGEIAPGQFMGNGFPTEVLRAAEEWNRQHGCETVEALNSLVNTPRFAWLVEAGDAAHTAQIRRIVETVKERRPKVLVVSGCSSSGKSTTARKIEAMLEGEGIPCTRMELDHYFLSYKDHPRDRHGDFDYETPQALDLRRINADIAALLDGRVVVPSVYDFESGQSRPGNRSYDLRGGKLLLLDSLYGAFPPMTACVPRDEKVIVHVEALHTILEGDGKGGFSTRPTDMRLLRRMVRDARPQADGGRSYPIDKTLGHWHFVRRGELRDLIPYIGAADIVVNGGFAFDLPVLKPFLERNFPSLQGFLRRGRLDAYIRGVRVKHLLDSVEAQRDLSFKVVPKDCIIREFIGYSTQQLPLL